MRGHLSGTKHSAILNWQEKAIFGAIQATPGVRKVEAGRMAWTGSTYRLRLRLRRARFPGGVQEVIEAWLFIASGKRLIIIIPEVRIMVEALAQALTVALARYKVAVEIMEGDTMEEQLTQVNGNHRPPSLTREQRLAYCETICDNRLNARTLKDQEAEIELRLEEVREEIHQVEEEALTIFARLLDN